MAPEEQAEVELDDVALGNAVGGAASVTINASFTPVQSNAQYDTDASVGGGNSTLLVYASTFVPFDSSF